MMENLKAFNVRIPRELWAYLKKLSVDKEKSMNDIVTNLILKHKKNSEKSLTNNNAII